MPNYMKGVYEEQEASRAQLINDVSLVGQILGLDVRTGLIFKQGLLMPALRIGRAKRATRSEIEALREEFKDKRVRFRKMLHLSTLEGANYLGDKYIRWYHYVTALISPKWTFWNIYRKIENELELGFVPVIRQDPMFIGAMVNVVPKPRKERVVHETKKD